MEQLPTEILEKILLVDTLNIQDVLNVSSTSKHFYDLIINNNTIWRLIFLRRFPYIWNQLEKKPESFYDEIKYIFRMRKNVRMKLDEMLKKYYLVLELSNEDLSTWIDDIQTKNVNFIYISSYLLEILSNSTSISNLTHQYYAEKVLRYIRQYHLQLKYRQFISKKSKQRILEEAAVIISEWSQPETSNLLMLVQKNLDEIADTVKKDLFLICPGHPIFQTDEDTLQMWKAEKLPQNAWPPKYSNIMIIVINKVFNELGFKQRDVDPIGAGHASDYYIDHVLQRKLGIVEILGIIYEGIARRLGVRCEPVYIHDQLCLWFCENESDESFYYIKLSKGAKILRRGSCPASQNRTPLPAMSYSAEGVMQRIAERLEAYEKTVYTPSGRSTRLRAVLELLRILNPSFQTLMNLVEFYKAHNLNISSVIHELKLLYPDTLNSLLSIRSIEELVDAYQRDTTIKPVRRSGLVNEVKYIVGMVMYHKLFRYRCVIFNWDAECMADAQWIRTNNVLSLPKKDKQPFYNVLAEDNSHRYVAQENLIPIHVPEGLHLDREVGRYFTHYSGTHYVPNSEMKKHYPDDEALRHDMDLFVKSLPIGNIPNVN